MTNCSVLTASLGQMLGREVWSVLLLLWAFEHCLEFCKLMLVQHFGHHVCRVVGASDLDILEDVAHGLFMHPQD